MNQNGKNILFIIMLLITSSIAMADEVPPNNLIKVIPENNQHCVQYFIYKSTLYCTTTTSSTQPIDPNIKHYETLNIVFDERPWQIAWGNKNAAITTVEYIPMGDNIDHWNELITSQFFPDLQNKISVKQFAESLPLNLRKLGYTPKISYLEDAPNQVIMEMQIASPENQVQDELIMLTKDNKGMYLLHYVIKKSDMGQKAREQWVHHLKNSTIM